MAMSTSMTVRSFEAKRNAALAAIAVSIARMNNDVLYAKLRKHRAIWKDTKNMILSKYSGQATQKWALNQAKGK